VLELDHVFTVVTDSEKVARRLADDGWTLDAGQVHRGQGTRNRRLILRDCFLEVMWVTDVMEASVNPLHLDRRAASALTNASPSGLGFRGQMDEEKRDQYWLYDALGPRIWIHRDNETHPERPMVFVVEADQEQMQERRMQLRGVTAAAGQPYSELRQIRLSGPSPPSLPPFAGPPVQHALGRHTLELVFDPLGSARSITEWLIIRR
jgi:hypothetical protein